MDFSYVKFIFNSLQKYIYKKEGGNFMKIGLNIGHYGTVGAEGFLSEVICNTQIYGELLPMLKKAGHTIVACNDATTRLCICNKFSK